MITRQQYLDNLGETNEERMASHRAYYAQFVDDRVVQLVLRNIGRDRLIRSTDPHFNDVYDYRTRPLELWDRLTSQLPRRVIDALKERGDYLTAAGGVCILKEAARQIVEAARDYVNIRTEP